MRVEVYWNIRKSLWSVRALAGPDKGRVIGHFENVWLNGCTLVVQPAGRERVRREGRKNVHAFVRGTLDPRYDASSRRWEMGDAFSYNPYRDDTFKRIKDNTPIHTAAHVRMSAAKNDWWGPWCRAWGSMD
jgi:hypothetical protein